MFSVSLHLRSLICFAIGRPGVVARAHRIYATTMMRFLLFLSASLIALVGADAFAQGSPPVIDARRAVADALRIEAEVAFGANCDLFIEQSDPHGTSIMRMPDKDAWAVARKTQSLTCYQTFLRLYPNIVQAAEARLAMRALAAKLPLDRPSGPYTWRSNYVPFNMDDYPPSAIRRGAQGRVTVEISISEFGIPDGCRVLASSGDAELDDATCRIYMRRLRFIPAIDREGKLIASKLSMPPINWKIPDDTPREPSPRGSS
jgi:TonB family protein